MFQALCPSWVPVCFRLQPQTPQPNQGWSYGLIVRTSDPSLPIASAICGFFFAPIHFRASWGSCAGPSSFSSDAKSRPAPTHGAARFLPLRGRARRARPSPIAMRQNDQPGGTCALGPAPPPDGGEPPGPSESKPIPPTSTVIATLSLDRLGLLLPHHPRRAHPPPPAAMGHPLHRCLGGDSGCRC
jgi:hypothetical protein